MSFMNRMGNATNPAQGKFKRVLCVCSAGLLRSPTAAVILSKEPFNFNTRAAGLVPEFALIPVDNVLLAWADEVVCMEPRQADKLRDMGCTKPIICLDIDDNFYYRDHVLMALVAERYKARTEKAA